MHKCMGRTIQRHTFRHMLESKCEISTQVMSLSGSVFEHGYANTIASAWLSTPWHSIGMAESQTLYLFFLLWPQLMWGDATHSAHWAVLTGDTSWCANISSCLNRQQQVPW